MSSPAIAPIRVLLPLLGLLLSTGCASLPGPAVEHDPWEGFNRTMYSFNDRLDRAVLKPTAEAYVAITPSVLRTGVHNFFSNLDDVLVIINDVLQLKITQALQDTTRLVFNTTLGLYGLIDVASGLDLPKHEEDFGQTLGYWGVSSGPYLVLPLFGPSSLRDTAGDIPDDYYSPLNHIKPRSDYYAAVVINTVNTRAGLLEAGEILDTAALDPYAFMREAYLQRRVYLVHDGNPPEAANNELDDDALLDELDTAAPPP